MRAEDRAYYDRALGQAIEMAFIDHPEWRENVPGHLYEIKTEYFPFEWDEENRRARSMAWGLWLRKLRELLGSVRIGPDVQFPDPDRIVNFLQAHHLTVQNAADDLGVGYMNIYMFIRYSRQRPRDAGHRFLGWLISKGFK